MVIYSTPFAVHYEKIRSLLRETATNSAKIHSLTWKYEHLRINQIQLQFLHFNQHSTTLLGIHMRHWAYKREKYTFIKANIKVINTMKWKYIFLFCMSNDANECPKMLLNVDWNAKIVIESDLCANVRFFALMKVSSRCWSPFHPNECVFSRNEQQKV